MIRNFKKDILLIPFSAEENNFSLYMQALNWRYVLQQANKLHKMPDIFIYTRGDKTIEDLEGFKGAKFKFRPEDIPPGTRLYIIMHGYGDANFVVNTDVPKEEEFFLPMQLLAERLKKMGLTPQLASNLQALKLYACNDEIDGSTLKLATTLGQALGPRYAKLLLTYYTANSVWPPDKNGHKQAVLYHKSGNEKIYSNPGRASQYKDYISVAQTLMKKFYPLHAVIHAAVASDKAVPEHAMPDEFLVDNENFVSISPRTLRRMGLFSLNENTETVSPTATHNSSKNQAP